jgi:hypothetical protein
MTSNTRKSSTGQHRLSTMKHSRCKQRSRSSIDIHSRCCCSFEEFVIPRFYRNAWQSRFTIIRYQIERKLSKRENELVCRWCSISSHCVFVYHQTKHYYHKSFVNRVWKQVIERFSCVCLLLTCRRRCIIYSPWTTHFVRRRFVSFDVRECEEIDSREHERERKRKRTRTNRQRDRCSLVNIRIHIDICRLVYFRSDLIGCVSFNMKNLLKTSTSSKVRKSIRTMCQLFRRVHPSLNTNEKLFVCVCVCGSDRYRCSIRLDIIEIQMVLSVAGIHRTT